MRIIATAWISGSLGEFEAHCALSVHSKAGYQHGLTPLEVFILNGMEKLDDNFIANNRAAGIIFHDATELTDQFTKKYSGLIDQLTASQGQMYELYCYVRWLVVDKILKGESFLHIDLDLFFQKSLDEISIIFTDVTGTFGSPCLTAVSDANWVKLYREALDQMLIDRKSFQENIRYTGNEFRPNISSDQDLVNALELQDLLPRSGIDDLIAHHAVFVNPIWPYHGAKPKSATLFRTVDGIDYIDNKPVLFWHLQNNFADYLSRYAILQNYRQSWLGDYLPCRLDLPFIQLQPTAENFAFQAMRDYIWPIGARHTANGQSIHDLGFEKFFSRTWLSEWFVLHKQGRGLFTEPYWWEPGVFLPATGQEKP